MYLSNPIGLIHCVVVTHFLCAFLFDKVYFFLVLFVFHFQFLQTAFVFETLYLFLVLFVSDFQFVENVSFF